MKQNRHIITLLLALVIIYGCRKSEIIYPPHFTLVEHEENTNVADMLLKELEDTINNAPEAVRMKYKLLRIKTDDRMGVKSDIDITEVANYYQNNGTPDEKMTARFYLAISQQDKGEYLTAGETYQEAIELIDIESGCNMQTASDIYFYAGNLSFITNNNKEAVEFYKKSLTLLTDRHRSKIYSRMIKCSEAMLRLKDSTRAIAYIDSIITTSKRPFGYHIPTGTLTGIIKILLQCNKTEKITEIADDLLLHIVSDNSDSHINSGELYNTLAKFYEQTKDEETMIKCLTLASNRHNSEAQLQLYYNRFKEYKKQNKYKRATEYAMLYTQMQDSLYQMRNNLLTAEIEKERKKTEEISKQLVKEDITPHYAVIIAIAFTIIIILILGNRRTAKPQKQNHNKILFSEAAERMSQLADKGEKTTPAEWNALTDAIHANYPHFTDRLREKYKEISRTELQVSYLSAIGLRQKQMSSLMNTTPQNIHNIRYRLYSRLTGERCNTVRQFDELIENIKSDN